MNFPFAGLKMFWILEHFGFWDLGIWGSRTLNFLTPVILATQADIRRIEL
jgi:hypothetical protein